MSEGVHSRRNSSAGSFGFFDGVDDAGVEPDYWSVKARTKNDQDVACRRMNEDMDSIQIRESQVLQLRWEVFNVFNTTQFFGPEAVNGDVDNPLFGHVVNAAPPRLMQLAVKYTF